MTFNKGGLKSYFLKAVLGSSLVSLIWFAISKWGLNVTTGKSLLVSFFLWLTVLIVALLANPKLFYRKVVVFGLGLVGLGSWDFQLKLDGADFGIPILINFGTGSSIAMIVGGVVIALAGLAADFKQRQSDSEP